MSDNRENDALKEANQSLLDYYVNSRISNKPCKILVTYDSFRHVKELIGNEALNDFYVVVDEAQSIFTDSRFKSNTELEFIQQLSNVRNVCYASATPMLDKYLEMVDEFKDLPYFELDWAAKNPHKIYTT